MKRPSVTRFDYDFAKAMYAADRLPDLSGPYVPLADLGAAMVEARGVIESLAKELGWAASTGTFCPRCLRWKPHGHTQSCSIGEALRMADEWLAADDNEGEAQGDRQSDR